MTVEQILKDACTRADEDETEYKGIGVVYMNDILTEILSYENSCRSVDGQEALSIAVRISAISEDFPYHDALITPASLLLSSAIVEEDDLNKSSLWRNRAIDMLGQTKQFRFVDVPTGWGDSDG